MRLRVSFGRDGFSLLGEEMRNGKDLGFKKMRARVRGSRASWRLGSWGVDEGCMYGTWGREEWRDNG
jgi:hypothetical protein